MKSGAKKISILVPSKGRHKQLQRLIDSIVGTANNLSEIELVVAYDSSDKSYEEISPKGLDVQLISTTLSSMGELNTLCLSESRGSVIFLGNDDMVFRTYQWDSTLLTAIEKFPDEIYLCYGNDLLKGAKLSTFPIISRRFCELIESPFPKEFVRGFIDTQIFDIFSKLKKLGADRIVYFNDLIFEHLHYRAGKSSLDETYLSGLRHRYSDDHIYLQSAELRNKIVDYLRKLTLNPFEAEIPNLTKPIYVKSGLFNSFKFAGLIFHDQYLGLFEKIKIFIYFTISLKIR